MRRLLDRVAEATREKTEMVSSKVHTQLLEIADEKAMAAERRASELDKEVRNGTKNLKKHSGKSLLRWPENKQPCMSSVGTSA